MKIFLMKILILSSLILSLTFLVGCERNVLYNFQYSLNETPMSLISLINERIIDINSTDGITTIQIGVAEVDFQECSPSVSISQDTIKLYLSMTVQDYSECDCIHFIGYYELEYRIKNINITKPIVTYNDKIIKPSKDMFKYTSDEPIHIEYYDDGAIRSAEVTTIPLDKNIIFNRPPLIAKYEGGYDKLISDISYDIENIVRDSAQGKIIYKLIIDDKGKVLSVMLLKGLDPEINDLYINRLYNTVWIPAKFNDKYVFSSIIVPIKVGIK